MLAAVDSLCILATIARERFIAFRERLRLDALCIRLRRAGIHVEQGAQLFAVGGIKLGAGTRVCRNATIAACVLGPGNRHAMERSGNVTIGEHCLILPGAIIAAYGGAIEIGHHVSVNPGVILYGGGGLTIGDRTRIAAQTLVIPSNHVFSDPDVPIMSQGMALKGISIGSDVWVGAGAKILDGVNVGNGAVIGAGAVVNRDVEPNSIVVGVPARRIGTRARLSNSVARSGSLEAATGKDEGPLRTP